MTAQFVCFYMKFFVMGLTYQDPKQEAKNRRMVTVTAVLYSLSKKVILVIITSKFLKTFLIWAAKKSLFGRRFMC